MQWLSCDFHIHTTRSDGEYSMDEVVDLYGETGFDVIAITDHVLDTESITRYGRLAAMFDAWEVANRDDLFNVVELKKFNYIANSDFHEKRHLLS